MILAVAVQDGCGCVMNEPVGLMMVATLVLGATVVFARPARASTPEGSRATSPEHGGEPAKLLGGIELVFRDRYLLLVALLIVLLNWVNTTGGTLLADMASRDADARVAASAGTLAKDVVITAFYGKYYFWITLVGLAIQLLLVARVYRWVGMRGALLVLHSDGLASHWALEDYPGLALRHPGLIAGVLYRDLDRGTDDVTVVVIRAESAGHFPA